MWQTITDVRISSKGINRIIFNDEKEIIEFINLVDPEDFNGIVGFSHLYPSTQLDSELLNFLELKYQCLYFRNLRIDTNIN